MKKIIVFFNLLFPVLLCGQAGSHSIENFFLITIDGVRWNEVFTGVDSRIIKMQACVRDTSFMRNMYWSNSMVERRKKLMPFVWNVLVHHANLYGNKYLGNRVKVSNPYRLSYPGYNDLLTGNVDYSIFGNLTNSNPNINILELLNGTDEFKSQVAAFASWNRFPSILNTKRNKIPISSGYHTPSLSNTVTSKRILNLEYTLKKEDNTRDDLLTFVDAKDYVLKYHPKFTFIAFGEADEAAHSNNYDDYIQNISKVDKLLSEIWYFIQTDPVYKGKTALIITTDHGRGDSAKTWSFHNGMINGSEDSWLIVYDPLSNHIGECSENRIIEQSGLAYHILKILGMNELLNKFCSN